MEVFDENKLKEDIKKIIIKIKNNRHRPCYQNILTFYNRGRSEILSEENLISVIHIMIQEKEIINNAKDGKDSFNINPNLSLPESLTEAETCNALDKSNDIVGDTDNNLDKLENLENFINEQFYSVLTSRIKEEVKLAVDSTIGLNPAGYSFSNEKDTLIESLRSEVKFLKEQVANYNKIIELVSLKNDNHNDIPNLSYNQNTKVSTEKCKMKSNVETDESLNVENSNITPTTCEVQKTKKKKRTISIIGDSMVKDIKGFKMRNGMKNREKIYIKCFPGATTQCMEDYVKPSLKHKPDIILLHVGTNDLRSSKSAEMIAKEVINLSIKIKNQENEVIISSIISRNDSLDQKGLHVNTFLKELCVEHNLLYCDNSGISKNHHLNSNGLHLNYKGTVSLANNFLKQLNY